MKVVSTILLFLMLLQCGFVHAQKKEQEQIQEANRVVESGLKKRKASISAEGYFELGQLYLNKGDLVKSEAYFIKAKELFTSEKNKKGIAKSSRTLAQVQEQLNKTQEAVENFKIAADNSDSLEVVLNKNDYNRSGNTSSKAANLEKISENIFLNTQRKDTVEILRGYAQLANSNLTDKSTKEAIGNLQKGYQFSQTIPAQAYQFNSKLSTLYFANGMFDSAISIKKDLLNKPFIQNSTKQKAVITYELAQIYANGNNVDSAIYFLNQAFSIALKNNHTIEARDALWQLDSLYRTKGNTKAGKELYDIYLKALPKLILADSSFTETKATAAIEEKISLLEEEAKLQDEAIHRKNLFNYSLIAASLILLGLVAAIFHTLKKLRIKNKKIELQSLRREMNPHFIFNSLNSINQYIAVNDEIAANKYLSKFSTLMRGVMENSAHDIVPIQKEIEILQHYVQLEQARFADKFEYQFDVDSGLLNAEEVYVPTMLLQPFIENAIWHGLRYKSEKGLLQIVIKQQHNGIVATIDDNGVGIAQSQAFKTKNQKQHNSRGSNNVMERMKLLNDIYHYNISIEVVDKTGLQTGVCTTVRLPLISHT